jgi:hypothetical protein
MNCKNADIEGKFEGTIMLKPNVKAKPYTLMKIVGKYH